ncbi:MAG: hypothetical protein ACREL3_13280 [Gemmatimonadales bacterium]
MDLSHSASRFLASAVLVAIGLTGCSQSEAPSDFNPDGMSSDLGSAQVAFDSPISASFDASGGEIAGTLGAAAPVVVSPAIAMLHPSTARDYAASMARLLPSARSPISAAVIAIPATVLGTTFVWDADSGAYVASDLTGAPAKGVRFMLYAVNPISRLPVVPLQELGYVDLTDVSTGSVKAIRVLAFAGGVTYLDYTVSGSGTSTSGTVTITGFASNGATRANFTLQNTIAQTANGVLLTLDYSLTIPSRGLSVNYSATFGNIAPQQVAVTLDFAVTGRNGNVNLSGTYGASGGTFSVKVNGSIFATVTLSTDSDPVVTGTSDTALTPPEEASIRAVLDFYDGSLAVFDDLLAPVN